MASTDSAWWAPVQFPLLEWLQAVSAEDVYFRSHARVDDTRNVLVRSRGSKMQSWQDHIFILQLYSLLGNPDRSHSGRRIVSIRLKIRRGRSKSRKKCKVTYPMPVPTHILVTPIFSPLLLSS